MNPLTHTTSKVIPNMHSNRYIPGLHGRPSTILIGAPCSKPTVARLASMSKLPYSTGVSLLRMIPNSAGLSKAGHVILHSFQQPLCLLMYYHLSKYCCLPFAWLVGV
jgi:hypothetical protein